MRKKILVLIAVVAVVLLGATFGLERSSCPLPRRAKKQPAVAKLTGSSAANPTPPKGLDR